MIFNPMFLNAHGWVTLKHFFAARAVEGYLFRGYLPPRHELRVAYNHLIF